MTHRTGPLALVLSTSLLLAACGGEPEPTGSADGGIVATGPGRTADGADGADGQDAATQGSPDDDATQDPDTADSAGSTAPQAALDAVALAEEDTGGVALELEDEDDGTWKVGVGVGEEMVEVTVGGDGSEVLGRSSDGPLDAAEREVVDSAGITLADAVLAAFGEARGALEDVDVDGDGDRLVWEVGVAQHGGGDTEVEVDVVTGEVLRVQTD